MIKERESNGLYRLLYVSRSSNGMVDAAVTARDIADGSEPTNRANGVTGALVAHASWFIQALEGPHEAVTSIYAKIAKDPRHRDLQVISVEPIEARLFPRWGMRAGRMQPTDLEPMFDASKMTEATLLGLLKLAVFGFAKPRAA